MSLDRLIKVCYTEILLIFTMSLPQNTAKNDAFKERLECLLEQKSDKLMNIFIQQGPDALRKNLNIKLEKHWEYVFDYLVYNEAVLKRCVVNFMPFFKHMVVRGGPAVLRKVFKIEARKYDSVYEQLFDLVAAAEGAIYDHLYLKKDEYVLHILNGQTKDLRKQLCPASAKYDILWWKLLEMLQEAVCTKVSTQQKFEQGIRAFTSMMNGLREHRSLRSFKGIWSFSAKVGE